MKRNLLLALIMMGASTVVNAQEDITPSGYKWNETGVLPAISSVNVVGSNPAVPAFTTWKGETEYNNGLIGLDDNAAAAYTNVTTGMSIVDLGGEVGKVLAIRGAACNNVETDLKTATGRDITLPQMAAATTWFDLNFFTDPNNTPTSSSEEEALPTDAYIHVKLVFNLYTDDQTSEQEKNNEAANITGILAAGNQNNLKPAGGVAGGKYYAYNFFTTEKEGEYAGEPAYDDNGNATWDATRWAVYEFDTWCPSAAEDGTIYTPLRLKLSCNNWGNFSTETLFIKELTFTKCTGTPTMDCYEAASKTYTTLKPGESTHVDVVENASEASNAPKYNLAGQRVNDSYKGVVIQNGKKHIAR